MTRLKERISCSARREAGVTVVNNVRDLCTRPPTYLHESRALPRGSAASKRRRAKAKRSQRPALLTSNGSTAQDRPVVADVISRSDLNGHLL